MMVCQNPECVGQCQFDRVAFWARRRFVDGVDTVTLLTSAGSEDERREIALAALLDLEDENVALADLFRCQDDRCPAHGYRQRLKRLLEQPLRVAGF